MFQSPCSLTMAKLVRVNTKIEVADYCYQWDIENFRFSCNRPVGKAINSPIFSIPNTKVKGCLKVYPSGVSEEYKDYVSVYLELKNYKDVDLVAKFDLWIPEANKSKKNSGLVNFSLKEGFGYPDYIKREYVLDSENRVLVDEKLTLMCHISVNTGDMNSSNMSDLEIVSVESSLVKDFKRLLDERCQTDVTLKIGEQSFQAHKIVLMTRSETFKFLFTQSNDKTEFEIKNVPVELMHDFLQYIYTGKVNVDRSKLIEFWKVVYCYNLEDSELQDKCETELLAKIDHKNAIELLELGLDWGLEKLYDKCFDYIVEHFAEMVQQKSYNKLLKSDPDLEIVILKSVSDSFFEKFYVSDATAI